MSANINALLDKCEDPEKMIDQYMRNLESDLGKVKAETASVMAEETRAKRELDECTEQINKMQAYAEKALKAGSSHLSRSALILALIMSLNLVKIPIKSSHISNQYYMIPYI